jgi:hypothetical protein
MTEQGIPIPASTELVKTSSATSLALPLFGTLGLMTLLSHDYNSRIARGIPVGHPALPLSRKILDQMEGFAQEHPLISTGIGTLGLAGLGRSSAAKTVGGYLSKGFSGVKERARNVLRGFTEGEKISTWLENIIPAETDTVMLPTIDLDCITEKIGEIIVEA